MRLILAIVLLTSCATPYQESGWRGGYYELAVAAEIYQVNFAGNGYTGIMTVKAYWLRRCAELTKLKGFQFFEVVGTDSGTDTSAYSQSGNVTIVNKHTATGTIRLTNEPSSKTYDAKIILGNYAH